MLPPMAVFFPLFTLLEDSGYLPRIAYNLDRPFQCCKACENRLYHGYGFGCNAAGITGCRIIDSPRERLIAMITNSFVPCNGRLPLFITLILLFLSEQQMASFFCCQCPAAYFVHPFRDRHDFYYLLPFICNDLKRSFLFLYLRASPLQEAPDRQSDLSLGNRPYFVCPWKSCCRSCSFAGLSVDHGKYSSGKYKPSCTFQPVFRPSWTSYGDGRRYPYSFYP